MEDYWLFWHACCLASETTGAHVSLGSPFCRQLNPSCWQEACLLICLGVRGFFGLCFFSVFLATFQHVTHFVFLRVKILSFLGKVSQKVFPSWASSLRQIPRNWRNYLCVFFLPWNCLRAQNKMHFGVAVAGKLHIGDVSSRGGIYAPLGLL